MYGYNEPETQFALWERQALPVGYQWGSLVTDSQRGRTLRFITRGRDGTAVLCRVTPCSEDEWQGTADELAAEIDATIERTNWEAMARARVEADAALAQHAGALFYDWPNMADRWQWVATADVAEILDWAQSVG